MKEYKLNGQAKFGIPAIGFGTWQLTGIECQKSVSHAIKVGYRHIDTAQAYGNHRQVGQAILSSGVPRGEIFLTSKVFKGDLYHDSVIKVCELALKDLKTDYLDLFLVHWPNKGIPMMQTLSALRQLKERGKIKAYGVSNYTVHHLEDALELGFHIPVNQVEFHPSLNQKHLKKFCDEHKILITAYSPIAQGLDLKIPLVINLAQKYGKSESQIILNWLVNKDMIVIPRSSNPERIKQNFESLSFEMEMEDYQQMENLDQGNRVVNPGFGEFDY